MFEKEFRTCLDESESEVLGRDETFTFSLNQYDFIHSREQSKKQFERHLHESMIDKGEANE